MMLFTKNRILTKLLALVLVAAFLLTASCQPINQARMVKEFKESIQHGTYNYPYGNIDYPIQQVQREDTKLGSFATELGEYHAEILMAVEDQDLEKLKDCIEEKIQAFQNMKDEVFAELDVTDTVIAGLNSQTVAARQKEFRKELEKNFTNLDDLLDSLDNLYAGLTGYADNNFDILVDILEEIGNIIEPEQPHAPLGHDLPHDNLLVEEPPLPVTGSGIIPAYLNTAVDGEMSLLPREPQAEDLAETIETRQDDLIKALADSLGTPVAMYEYVKNNIDFDPYYGSRKGALGTLQQAAGNDMDQASLLIAMFRYKGIPARYVRGTIEIPAEKAMGWTGAETPEAAARILGSSGRPVVSMLSKGSIAAVRLEHTWVEAYIPYENYRGAGRVTGQEIWVPLDPSFKQYEWVEGLDLAEIAGIDFETLVGGLGGGSLASPDGNYFTRVETESFIAELDEAEERLMEYLILNELEEAEGVFGGKKIIPEELGLLPASLPYHVVTVIDELQSIPSSLSDMVSFSIRGSDPFGLNFGGTAHFSYQTNAPELFGKKITLTWIPATAEDEAILDQFGGIFATPAYLVMMKPQIKIDGEVKATGKAVGLGYRQEFTITIKSTGLAAADITNPVTVGGIYNVGLNYGSVSAGELQAVAESIEDLQDSISIDTIYSDQCMGEILNAVATAYYAQLDIFNSLLAGQFNVTSYRLLSEAITAYNVKPSYLFMSPVKVNEGSMYIDVDRDIHAVVNNTGDRDAAKAYMLASGIAASAMEHRIFEQMTGVPSVSTIKILEEANQRGVPIYNITAANLQEVLPELEVSQSVKNDIKNAVNAGRIVVIPQRNIQYFDWYGAGYIVLDPETGAAGYMISGGIAGGAMSIDEVLARYVAYVVSGLILMVLVEVVKIVSLAMLPAGLVFGLLAIAAVVAITFMVRNMIMLYQMYQITGDVSYLQEIFIQLAAIATLGFLRLGPMKSTFAELDALSSTVILMKQYGVPAGVTLRFLATYGVSRATQATQTMLYFRNYGFSNSQMLTLAGSFDRITIMQIQNVFMKSVVAYTNTEILIILSLFRQAGTTTAVSTLSNNIIALTNSGVLPSLYLQYGIIGLPGVIAGASALIQGITPYLMGKLAGFNIMTTDYLGLRIDTYDMAQAVVDASEIIHFGLRDIEFSNIQLKTAEEINSFWLSKGYNNPPYHTNLPVCQVRLMQDTYFVRVYDNVESMKYGQFLMKLEDITNPDGTYLTALEIKDKYALGFVPKYIADVKVPENTIINTGIAGPIQGWGRGGGLQFDLFGQGTGEFTERDTLP